MFSTSSVRGTSLLAQEEPVQTQVATPGPTSDQSQQVVAALQTVSGLHSTVGTSITNLQSIFRETPLDTIKLALDGLPGLSDSLDDLSLPNLVSTLKGTVSDSNLLVAINKDQADNAESIVKKAIEDILTGKYTEDELTKLNKGTTDVTLVPDGLTNKNLEKANDVVKDILSVFNKFSGLVKDLNTAFGGTGGDTSQTITKIFKAFEGNDKIINLGKEILEEFSKTAFSDNDTSLKLLLSQLKDELTTMTVKTTLGNNSELAKSLGTELFDLFAKDLDVANIPAGVTDKEAYIKDLFVKKIEQPIKAVTQSLSKLTSGGGMGTIATINQVATTNTTTRLAKLSTPYSKDFALASAIKNMNGIELASVDNSALLSMISEYTKRFEYDNSLWANVLGAKGSTDNGNPKLYGFSVGYDRSFDEHILGTYFTYAKSKVDVSLLQSEADNFELGIYSRAYFGQSELDTSISFGIAKNDINNYKLVSQYLNGNYDSEFANISANYGYVFKVQDGFFIKPFAGLAYSYNRNDSFSLKNDSKTIQEINKVDGSVLSANFGVEFRQYLSDGSFIFAAPGIERELSVSKDDLVSKFNGANTSFITKADESKNTYGKIIVGGEYSVSKIFQLHLVLD